MRKSILVFLTLTSALVISIAATKPAVAKNYVAASSHDTGYFKNLQILPKDISKEKLDMIMDNFKTSLGVRCGFCHAFDNGKPNFASDEKPEKEIARHMMTMTADINVKYFNFENSTMPDTIAVVGCITCHRGNPHPDEVKADSSNHHDMMPPPGGMPPPNGTPPPGGMPPPNGTPPPPPNGKN